MYTQNQYDILLVNDNNNKKKNIIYNAYDCNYEKISLSTPTSKKLNIVEARAQYEFKNYTQLYSKPMFSNNKTKSTFFQLHHS